MHTPRYFVGVLSHPILVELLRVTDVEFLANPARRLVNYTALPTITVESALTVDLGPRIAVTLFVLEVLGNDTFHHFPFQIALDDFS
jgi:hypothetical protein